MPDIIDRNHYAFIKGRQILDSVLIANECVEDYKRRKQKGGVVKLALEKAYDKTNRNFLDFVLARKGVGAKWRSWMHGCLSFTHFQVIINSSRKGFFPTSRGLRQGDPLSPFLFSVVADSLGQIIFTAKSKALFKGFNVGPHNVKVSHLQFADEL